MNRKRGLIIASLIALFAALLVWFVLRAPITVELRVLPASSPDTDGANIWLEKIGSWVFRAALVVIPAVGAFFFFRERRRQRAYDRRKPPS